LAPTPNRPTRKPHRLSIDLKLGKENGRIHRFAAIRSDTYASLNSHTSNTRTTNGWEIPLASALPIERRDGAYQLLSGPHPDIGHANKIPRNCGGEDFCLTLALLIAGSQSRRRKEARREEEAKILTNASPLGAILRIRLQSFTNIGAVSRRGGW